MLLSALHSSVCAQDVAIKTNGLYWLAVTPNAGVEFATADKWTLELSGYYNPFTFNKEKKFRYWFAQPEMKYWLSEKFKGHFLGLQAHSGQFYSTLVMRRDGYFAGGGLSYGYDWALSHHFNLEAEVGVGYARFWYKESECLPCIKNEVRKYFNYYGLTRLALSVGYIF